jgi:CRP-like cAMP-binding protein
MEPEEIKKLMQTYPIISGWIQELPEALMYRCRLSYPSRGQSLFCKGDEMQKVYIVCRGNVIITSSNLNGNEMGVVVVPEGASVGEMEAMMGLPQLVYSAKALTDCILLEIPLGIFKRLMDINHSFCKRLAMELSRKLYSSSVSTVHYQSWPAQTRLKLFLIDCGEGKVLETREKLAEFCGVSTRTINRCVNSLKEEGYLNLVKRKILLDKEHIRKLTESIAKEI